MNNREFIVNFIGSALVVKDIYNPEYQFVPSHGENHTFKVSPDRNHSFEYMLSSAWSEGAVFNNKIDFTEYIRKSAREFNNPLIVRLADIEEKQ